MSYATVFKTKLKEKLLLILLKFMRMKSQMINY